MAQPKQSYPPHKQLTKKKKILLGILLPCSILVTASAGVGVGWCIWHSKTKSISAVASGTCQIGDTAKCTRITVTGYNGVNLNNLNEPTFNGLHFGEWGSDGANKKIIDVSWEDATATAGDKTIDITCDGISTECQVVVEAEAPTPSSFIKISSNNVQNYLIASNTPIYVNQGTTFECGHQLLDLKMLSDVNNGICNFIIQGSINFGFLVDPNMNCLLFGDTNSLVNISASSANACGVVVGQRNNPSTSIAYKGTMYIDNSVDFNIGNSAKSSIAYGVYFYTTTSGSTQIINGTFTISASNSDGGIAYGIYCFTANGSTIINGTFTITSDGTSSSIGCNSCVYFYTTNPGSTQIINGTFTITTTENYSSATGVYFGKTTSNSIQTINGTFTITSNGNAAYGVWLNGDSAGYITINGTFTINDTNGTNGNFAAGVHFKNTASGSTQTINGTFTITSTNASSIAYGVYFSDTASGLLTMSGTNFFSNKVDSGNIFGSNPKYGSWDGSYKWNGITIDKSHTFTDADRDTNLTLIDIYDTSSATDRHFNIKVIGADGKDNESKKTFNNAYKYALDLYVTSSDCPTTAKGWLESIIDKIPIPA